MSSWIWTVAAHDTMIIGGWRRDSGRRNVRERWTDGSWCARRLRRRLIKATPSILANPGCFIHAGVPDYTPTAPQSIPIPCPFSIIHYARAPNFEDIEDSTPKPLRPQAPFPAPVASRSQTQKPRAPAQPLLLGQSARNLAELAGLSYKAEHLLMTRRPGRSMSPTTSVLMCP